VPDYVVYLTSVAEITADSPAHAEEVAADLGPRDFDVRDIEIEELGTGGGL
jgi:hypothetical protein